MQKRLQNTIPAHYNEHIKQNSSTNSKKRALCSENVMCTTFEIN